jgi:ribosomal protein S18 acetylase RimI-like enzyme
MIVRKTTEKDMELLVQLRMAYLLDQNKEETTENQKQLINNLYAYFEKAIMRNEFLAVVAEDEGKAVSTAFMSIAERPPRPGSSSNRVGTIYSVYTDPEYRRRGIATKVLQLLLQEAKENNVATVDLSATADRKPLYEKLGFTLPKYTYMKLKLEA